MTMESWDPDQAVVHGPLDAELEGCSSIDRYGVRPDEELHGEPLDVVLQQEERDIVVPSDDEWVFVDDDDDPAPFADMDGPEERAMHLLLP